MYKCMVCSEKDLDENMIIVEKVGKSNRRVHKEECHDKYLEEKEFKKKEKLAWDSLYETVKDVHEIELFPPGFTGQLQKVRNGTPIYGSKGNENERYKEGFSYEEIERTYLRKKDLIRWKKPQWNGSTGHFLNFVLTFYVLNEIEDISNEMKSIEHSKREFEIDENNDIKKAADISSSSNITYKKKKSKNDISDILF